MYIHTVVLTLKGKPLGRNPNRVNPTVFWSSTVHPCSLEFYTVVETLGPEVMHILHSLSQRRKGCN
jgi:hypothetical protein